MLPETPLFLLYITAYSIQTKDLRLKNKYVTDTQRINTRYFSQYEKNIREIKNWGQISKEKIHISFKLLPSTKSIVYSYKQYTITNEQISLFFAFQIFFPSGIHKDRQRKHDVFRESKEKRRNTVKYTDGLISLSDRVDEA